MQSTAGFGAARFSWSLPGFALLNALWESLASCRAASDRQIRSLMQYAGIIRMDCFRYCRTKVHGRVFERGVSCGAHAVRTLLRDRARPGGADDARRAQS